MMATLFLIMTGAIASVFFGKRGLSITILLVVICLGWLMLWHHATDTLNVNW